MVRFWMLSNYRIELLNIYSEQIEARKVLKEIAIQIKEPKKSIITFKSEGDGRCSAKGHIFPNGEDHPYLNWIQVEFLVSDNLCCTLLLK